jgi:hypothetical protein
MNTLDVIKSYADTWRSLAAWRAPLDVAVKVTPMPAHHTRRLGTAWPCQRRANVYVIDGDLTGALSTLLHELAHLAAPTYAGHEMPWRAVYVAAVAEATRCDVDMFDTDLPLDEIRPQVHAAIDAWLDATGQRTVLTALGVIPARRLAR